MESLFSQNKFIETQPEISLEDSLKLDVPKVIRKRQRQDKLGRTNKKHISDSSAVLDVSKQCSAGEEAIKRIQLKRIVKLRKAEDLISRTFISGIEKRQKIYEKLLKEL